MMTAKVRKDNTEENIQNIAQQAGVVGQPIAQRKGNRQTNCRTGTIGKT
jgi:hypothetical protein